jgi:sugar/nucleoside kinase (ribokinase family)
VAVGDLLLDVVVSPDRPLEPGSDVSGSVVFRRGGSAANTCAAFVRAGGSATLITSVGADGWVARLLASLRREAVRVHAVRVAGQSGRLAALVDLSGERSFVTQRAAADALRPDDLSAAWFRGASVLHLPAYSLFGQPIAAAALAAARLARDAGAIVSVDLSSAGPIARLGPEAAWELIAAVRADVLFANRAEAAALLGHRGARSLPRLLRLAPLAVVKDGALGCRVLWRGDDVSPVLQLEVAATRVATTDTTGAGDAFAAGFLHALLVSPVRLRDGGGLEAGTVRRAALAGHRAAAAALRHPRPQIGLA